MAQAIRVGIIGAGRIGLKHVEGYEQASGFSVVAVADRIGGRRKAVVHASPTVREYKEAEELLKDPSVDAVSVCLPNDQHLPVVQAALKSEKHVLCETPPARDAAEAKKMAISAAKAGKILLFAAQRRFGAAEQAAVQAIEKGYIGEAYHARVSWMRTRGIPQGTGWYTDKSKAGGGAMIDTGAQLLDLGWALLGRPQPTSVSAIFHERFRSLVAEGTTFDVEDAAFALLRFEGGKSLELSTSWAFNQAPRHHGTTCRVHGNEGMVEIYTSSGPKLYRQFDAKGSAKESDLKLPKVAGYAAMMRHFRSAIRDGVAASPGAEDATALMRMIDAIYKSATSGKSAEVR
jgi:predicted dehydrogenase